MSDHLDIPFDLALLRTTKYEALDAPSLRGLLRLYAAAWADGNRLPDDDDTLAAVSGLGLAFANSNLKKWLGRFFAPAEGHPGYLVAIDLWGTLAKRQAIRAARRAAGIASGAARRAKIEQVSSNLEHVFDKDLTEVLPLNDDDTPTPLRRKRKPRAEKVVAPVISQPPERAVPVENARPLAVAPVPYPSVRESLFVCVDTKHTQTQDTRKEGGVGGRGGQLLLWAAEEPPPAVSILPEPGAPEALVALYVATVKSAYPAEEKTAANVRHWLTAGGHTALELKAAIAGYAATVAGKDPRYRKAPTNFFAEDGFFKGYMAPVQPAGPSPEEAMRLREEQARAVALAREKDKSTAGAVGSNWKAVRERMKA